MAKALLGHVHSDLRIPAALASENARLRRRVADLEALLVALTADNDRLRAELDEHLLARDGSLQGLTPHDVARMQPV